VLVAALSAVGVLSAQVPSQPTTAPSSAPTTGNALLAGQVIDAATSRPIAGAVVTLGGMPSASPSNVIFNFSQAAIAGGNRQALTNGNGHFVFNELPAGVYSIQSTASGYVPGGYGKRRAAGPAQPINLGADDRIVDLSVPLSRYATISGRVIDEAGEPVVGVTVLGMRRVYDNGKLQYSTAAAGLTSSTDDRGEYRLSTLVPGEYILSIRSTQATVPTTFVEAQMQAAADGRQTEFSREFTASGGNTLNSLNSNGNGRQVGDFFFDSAVFGGRTAPPIPIGASGALFVYPTTFYPSAITEADATVIRVGSGESRTGMDLHLRPTPTSRISGVATGPSGPGPRLSLSLIPASSDLITLTFFETATTVTDARGAFVFLGIPAGNYVLRAMKIPPPPVQPAAPMTVVQTGNSTMFTPGARPALVLPEGPSLWASVPVTVGRSDVAGLTVSMANGFRIGGRLEFDGAADKPAPEAIGRQSARFEPADDRSPLYANSSADVGVFDAEGRLRSHELPPGRYYVTAGSFPNWTFKAAMVDGRDVSSFPLDLARSDIANVVLVYTDAPSSLSGTVRSVKGVGDVSAQVMLFPVEVVSEGFVGSMRRFRLTRVATTGAFRFNSVPPGDYLAIAVDAAAGIDFPSFSFLRSIAKQATRVSVGDRENKSVDLTTVPVR